jgi:N-acetylglutamate synthase
MPALSWRTEYACLNAWPSLSHVIHDGWMVRLADGLTRRANSVSPLHAGAKITPENLHFFEALFDDRDLPLIVRMPGLLDPSVDLALDKAGFTREGDFCVFYGDIDRVRAQADPAVTISDEAEREWLQTLQAMQGRSPAEGAIYEAIITSVVLPAGFAILRDNGEPVALAYGALDGDLLCCESVVTRAASRNKGYGRRLMGVLLQWAKDKGAKGVCLQVDAANAPAIALYRKIGIDRELYRYHYRRQP